MVSKQILIWRTRWTVRIDCLDFEKPKTGWQHLGRSAYGSILANLSLSLSIYIYIYIYVYQIWPLLVNQQVWADIGIKLQKWLHQYVDHSKIHRIDRNFNLFGFFLIFIKPLWKSLIQRWLNKTIKLEDTIGLAIFKVT